MYITWSELNLTECVDGEIYTVLWKITRHGVKDLIISPANVFNVITKM